MHRQRRHTAPGRPAPNPSENPPPLEGSAAPAEPPPGKAPARPPLSLADVLDLRLPLAYVMEADALWAEAALEGLLEARADAEHDGTVAARWTRARGGTVLGGHAFPLARTSASETLAREELARLSGVLAAGAAPGHGTHPLDGAVFAVRGLQAELAHPATAEVLAGAARALLARGATLLAELERVPAARPAWAAAARLGPVVALPAAPVHRYREALAVLREATPLAEGAPEEAEAARALSGLTLLQSLAAARMARRELAAAPLARPLRDVLSACAARVREAFAAGEG